MKEKLLLTRKSTGKRGDDGYKTFSVRLKDETVDKLKDGAEKVGAAVTEGAKTVQKAVVDFASKPEVRETLDKITDTAKDVYDKGVETLKKILDK